MPIFNSFLYVYQRVAAVNGFFFLNSPITRHLFESPHSLHLAESGGQGEIGGCCGEISTKKSVTWTFGNLIFGLVQNGASVDGTFKEHHRNSEWPSSVYFMIKR